MLEKYMDRCRRLANWHFWSTVVGVVLFFPSVEAARACFTVGASSLYTAFCYGAFDEVTAVAKLGAWWFVSYPVVHLITYIPAWKKRWYVPILVMVLGDLAFQLFAVVCELMRENFYGVSMIVPDIAVTVVFAVVFSVSLIRYRKERRLQQ